MSNLEEMMCRQCGSLLLSRDLVCPCCKTPRSVSKKTQYKSTRLESLKREQLFDAGPDKSAKINLDKSILSDIFGSRQQNSTYRSSHKTDKAYATYKSTKPMLFFGFMLGMFIPWFFTAIVALVFSDKALAANKVMRPKEKEMNVAFRKGMVRGAIVMQIVLPLIVGLVGFLFECL